MEINNGLLTEAEDKSNELIYRLSRETNDCDLVDEAQLVVDDFRQIVHILMVENIELKNTLENNIIIWARK